MFKSYRVINMIYTDGWLTGLTVKVIMLRFTLFKRYVRLTLWLYPMSYSRKEGLRLRETIRTLDKE